MTAQHARPGEVVSATVVVESLERTLPLWTELLGYRMVYEGAVDREVAMSWNAPAMAGCAVRVLAPASGAQVYLRLIESEAAVGFVPTRSFGWTALELTVEDVEELHRRLTAADYEIVGPPRELEFTDRIYPMQVMGRGNELLYLNQVRGNLPDFDLPIAVSPVDRTFIVVLAVPDLDASLSFYERALGFERGLEFEIPYGVINAAFGLAEETAHKLAMVCLGRTVNVEVDQYPNETIDRPTLAGHLPGGIAVVGLGVEDSNRLTVKREGAVLLRSEPPYDGRRTVTCRGAAGEWLEVVEIGSA